MDDQSINTLLIDELAADNVNILRIKSLCRENPGIIASSGLRKKIWTLFLLGHGRVDEMLIDYPPPSEQCKEQHVLEADIHRTRADMERFRSTSTRKAIGTILQHFCIINAIQYKQGMNEVLAPFIHLLGTDEDETKAYSLFEAFIFRYLERFFCVDDSSYLFKSFRCFHLLLLYFDPAVALHLQEQGFPPELYSPQWFLTLYSRALPIEHVLRLWDMFLAIDDPAFTFFIGLCLFRTRRDALLMSDTCKIPEIVTMMHFTSDLEIDAVVVDALTFYKATPKSLLRHLRLCCVSTADLTPLPIVGITPIARNKALIARHGAFNVHDKAMCIQSVRGCVMLSAQELINSVAPLMTVASPVSSPFEPGNEDMGSHNAPPQQFVLIDIRSHDEAIGSGGGAIPRAIQLEPEFLNRPDAFEIWLQHFDGTKGCNICIIDTPPPPVSTVSSVALWRRLLLGEGDGVAAPVNVTGISKPSRKRWTLRRGNNNSTASDKAESLSLSSSNSTSRHGESDSSCLLDTQSIYAKDEAATLLADEQRTGMQLAVALQTHGFSTVCVLDGGFPALVEQLLASRGTVEPVIINHDDITWEQYLASSGRKVLSEVDGTASNKRKGKPAADNMSIAQEDNRTVKDLREEEILNLALTVALRLNHTAMADILRKKIELASLYSGESSS